MKQKKEKKENSSYSGQELVQETAVKYHTVMNKEAGGDTWLVCIQILQDKKWDPPLRCYYLRQEEEHKIEQGRPVASQYRQQLPGLE